LYDEANEIVHKRDINLADNKKWSVIHQSFIWKSSNCLLCLYFG